MSLGAVQGVPGPKELDLLGADQVHRSDTLPGAVVDLQPGDCSRGTVKTKVPLEPFGAVGHRVPPTWEGWSAALSSAHAGWKAALQPQLPPLTDVACPPQAAAR